jgi:hypothetical protein
MEKEKRDHLELLRICFRNYNRRLIHTSGGYCNWNDAFNVHLNILRDRYKKIDI